MCKSEFLKMKGVVIAMAMLAAFASCKQSLSGDHLPPAVMQKVLLDVNLAEAYSTSVKDSVHRGGLKNTDSLAAFYKTIFAHYNITQAQFSASMEWYKAHPEEMDSVYNKMIPVATRWQSVYTLTATGTPGTPLPPPAIVTSMVPTAVKPGRAPFPAHPQVRH